MGRMASTKNCKASLHEADATLKETRSSASTEVDSMKVYTGKFRWCHWWLWLGRWGWEIVDDEDEDEDEDDDVWPQVMVIELNRKRVDMFPNANVVGSVVAIITGC